MAWLDRFCPTPGMSARTSMPCSRSCAAGPIPIFIRKCGEWMPPSEQITSRAVNVFSSPPIRTFTPVARRPSNVKLVTCAPFRIVKFFRARTSAVR